MPARPTTVPPAGAVLPPHRLATTLGALIAPLVVLGAAVALALSWRDRLPDPVASSWGAAGTVTGTSSLTGVLVAMSVPTAAIALAAWLVGMTMGRVAAIRRVAAGFATGLAVFVCGLVVGSLAGQRGLADAHHAAALGAMPAVAIAAALVLGALVAAAMPGDAPLPATGRVPAEAPRARLAGTAGASWTGVARFGHMTVVLVVGAALVAGIAVLTRSAWPTLLVAATLAIVAVMMWRWTVTIDDRGVLARTVLPWPRTVVPLEEVEHADVTTVDPVRDFGGWGYRLGRGGRNGIVLRSGEALVVHRSGSRRLVVTVDDAQRGAALLNTLVERSRRSAR
jgi:hypothetical protein